MTVKKNKKRLIYSFIKVAASKIDNFEFNFIRMKFN